MPQPFRYPYRIHAVVDPFMAAVLQTIDGHHDDPESDSPAASIGAALQGPLDTLLTYLEDRDRSLEDAVGDSFATRYRWGTD